MSKSEIWNNVDLYFSEKLHTSDSIMNSILKANSEAHLPAIDVAPNQGKAKPLQIRSKGFLNTIFSQ